MCLGRLVRVPDRVPGMSPAAVTLAILALAIVGFISNRVPLGIVAIGVSVAVWFTGVLDLGQALPGFGDPTVVFIACLFVVSEALDRTVISRGVARSSSERGRAKIAEPNQTSSHPRPVGRAETNRRARLRRVPRTCLARG